MTDNPKPKRPEQGLSLLDIGPAYELIPLGDGKDLKVSGISAKGIFSVFQRFPDVMKWFKGGEFKVADLASKAPDALAAVIAAGCGFPGDELAEEHASLLSVETQLDIIQAIGRLTFKNGFGPFVNRIVALSEGVVNSRNFGKVQATISQPPSNPVSPLESIPSSSGT